MISSGSNTTVGNISNLTYYSSSPGTNNYSNIELVRIIGDNDSISNNTSGSWICMKTTQHNSPHLHQEILIILKFLQDLM